MRNAVGVWTTGFGLGAVSWGATGSLRAAMVVGGLMLAATAALLLLDFGDDVGDA